MPDSLEPILASSMSGTSWNLVAGIICTFVMNAWTSMAGQRYSLQLFVPILLLPVEMPRKEWCFCILLASFCSFNEMMFCDFDFCASIRRVRVIPYDVK